MTASKQRKRIDLDPGDAAEFVKGGKPAAAAVAEGKPASAHRSRRRGPMRVPVAHRVEVGLLDEFQAEADRRGLTMQEAWEHAARSWVARRD